MKLKYAATFFMVFFGQFTGNDHAAAESIPCILLQNGAATIDGFLTEWEGADYVRFSQAEHVIDGAQEWTGETDSSFTVYCGYDDTAMYVAISAKDDRMLRTKSGTYDDHLRLLLNKHQLRIYPSDLRDLPTVQRWYAATDSRAKSHKPLSRSPFKAQIAESIQATGFSAEIALPWSALSKLGIRRGTLKVNGGIQFFDSDSTMRHDIFSLIGTGAGSEFAFESTTTSVSAFLKDKNYKAKDIRWQQSADMTGDDAAEHIVLAGRTIAVLGHDLGQGAYLFLDLDVAAAKDVQWVKLVDLNRDNKQEILIRYRQHGGGGQRDLVSLFTFTMSGEFRRVLCQEVAKFLQKNRLENRVEVIKRKGKSGLIISVGKVVGFDQQSFAETPDSEIYSILLPWGPGPKRREFRLSGEEMQVIE